MGLWDKLFGEFIDVIEWLDDSGDTMVYRFERYGNEIKYGAKLIVRESQSAVFVSEGEIADVMSAGIYELETKNIPILSTLQHWDHGFNSPFKAEVYFCSMRRFVDLKWGTKNPLIIRDDEFGAVRIRAFGTYSVRISDPAKFIREITGTDGYFTVDEISDQLRNLIVSRFANIVAKSKIPVLDMAAHYDVFSEYITKIIAKEFEEYGLELTKILIENISLPSAVEEALDKRTSMGMIGDIDKYLKYQSAEALTNSSNSSANEALSMGMGFAMANKMSEALDKKESFDTPPPVPKDLYYINENNETKGPYRLENVKSMIENKEINKDTLVWKRGKKDWEVAGFMKEFGSFFTNE